VATFEVCGQKLALVYYPILQVYVDAGAGFEQAVTGLLVPRLCL